MYQYFISYRAEKNYGEGIVYADMYYKTTRKLVCLPEVMTLKHKIKNTEDADSVVILNILELKSTL